MASSLDDSKVCRICLESHDHDDPFHGSRLIAPCQCRGTQGWVHRECLDRWRATREDRAFSQCTECFFAYEYVARDESGEDKGLFFDGGPLTPQRRRRLKFQMFVARDFLAVFVVMQICVLFLAAVRRAPSVPVGFADSVTQMASLSCAGRAQDRLRQVQGLRRVSL